MLVVQKKNETGRALWTGAWPDTTPNVTIYTERALQRKKSRTYRSLVLSAPLMVLLWEQVSAPIWRSWGVENRVGLNGTTSRALSVFDSGEQHWKIQQPTNVDVESAGGKLWRHTVARRLDELLSVVAVCGANATFSPTLHDACSTCADAPLPHGTVMSICTCAAAAELHFRPKHPQNTNCC